MGCGGGARRSPGCPPPARSSRQLSLGGAFLASRWRL